MHSCLCALVSSMLLIVPGEIDLGMILCKDI